MEEKERKVVIEKLPVSKPVPVEKPDTNIQLPPIVQPMAVVPFVSFDGDGDDVQVQVAADNYAPATVPAQDYGYQDYGYQDYGYQEPQQSYYDPYAYAQPAEQQPAYYAPQQYGNDVKQYGEYKQKSTKKGARFGGFLAFVAALIALAPFVLAYLNISITPYITAPNMYTEVMEIINSGNYLSNPPVIPLVVGILLLVIGALSGLLSLMFGSRPNYVILGILVLVCMVFGALWKESFNFTRDLLTNYEVITLAGVGVIYLLLGIIAKAISAEKFSDD